MYSWSCSGLLHSMRGTDVQFLFPLLGTNCLLSVLTLSGYSPAFIVDFIVSSYMIVQSWSARYSNSFALAYHIQQLFYADASHDEYSEKSMESLMYHYEAAIRFAQNGKPLSLVQYYCTPHFDKRFSSIYVKALVPPVVVLANQVSCKNG